MFLSAPFFVCFLSIVAEKNLEKSCLWRRVPFNLFYLVFVVFFLIKEKDSFFKFLLLMPSITTSLQYGMKEGAFWALFSTIGVIFINIGQNSVQADADILVIGMIWLFAWLLGKMSKTEQEIRTSCKRWLHMMV